MSNSILTGPWNPSMQRSSRSYQAKDTNSANPTRKCPSNRPISPIAQDGQGQDSQSQANQDGAPTDADKHTSSKTLPKRRGSRRPMPQPTLGIQVAKPHQWGRNSSRSQRPGGGFHVCLKHANMIQEKLGADGEAQY